MKKIFIGLMALALFVVSPALAGGHAPWLKSHITYNFVLFQGGTQNASFPS